MKDPYDFSWYDRDAIDPNAAYFEAESTKRRQERDARIANAIHWVYRCFDCEGRLIYVGCTMDVDRRMKGHEVQTWWYEQVARIEKVAHQGWAAGRAAERHAIQTERPRWNVDHRWSGDRGAWGESDYKDYAFARLQGERFFIDSPAVARIYSEYQKRFGVPLKDDRIDGVYCYRAEYEYLFGAAA